MLNFINNKVKITQTWEHNKQEQANYIQANEDNTQKQVIDMQLPQYW